MGYYSQVGICIKRKEYDELKARVEMTEKKEVLNLLAIADIQEKKTIVMIRWDSVKWYPEYKEVSFIMNYLAELSNNGIPYSFVRIGEELGDIETQKCYGEDEDDYSCDHFTVASYLETY